MINTTVVKITQSATFTANGQQVPSYIVQFTVGGNGPFTIQLAANEFNAANVKAKLDAFAKEISAIAPGA